MLYMGLPGYDTARSEVVISRGSHCSAEENGHGIRRPRYKVLAETYNGL